MRALIADDDNVAALMLARALERMGLEVVVAHDGGTAWRLLEDDGPFKIAIFDWMMPGADGLDLCRRIRRSDRHARMHVVLLTARCRRADVVAGLDAGADDYVIKPLDPEELRARVQVGIRIIRLQDRLAERVDELQQALSRVKQLTGLLPICSYCQRIRDDRDVWQSLDSYVSRHTEAQFSHGVCPSCFDTARSDFEAAASGDPK